MQHFQNSRDHLLAELALVDLLISWEVRRLRATAAREQDMFKGMYVSDADVDQLLSNPRGLHSEEDDRRFASRIATYRDELEEFKRAAVRQGIPLALPNLAHLFGLNSFQQRLLLLCLAPEIDPKYERLYGYLHDDISRRRATIGLALSLLKHTETERIEAAKEFSFLSPLFRSGLLRIARKAEDTYLRQTLVLDEIVVNYLLGASNPGSDMEACARFFQPRPKLEELRWSPQLRNQLERLLNQYLRHGTAVEKKLVVQLSGPSGTGKKTLAGALCAVAGVPLLVVDMQELMRRFADFDLALGSVYRYALLSQAAVCLDQFDSLSSDEVKFAACRPTLRRVLEEMSLVTFVTTEQAWRAGDSFSGFAFLNLELCMPDAGERKALWRGIAGDSLLAKDVDWDEIATQFRLTPGRMESAFQAASTMAHLRGGTNTPISRADLHTGCYSQSNKKLTSLAQRLVPRHAWEDIILPSNALTQLREICAQIKYRQRVYLDWGFERKLVRGKGLFALFCGHSGVGKTMAVEVLAHELLMEVYKIDLSTVVSKYIGETEKNLSKIFQEAQESNSILFFDEADALFGKRSEVKDAHDRYANIEINYLLQRMEEFDGLVVLATNLRRNIDEGFFRRMHFVVEFPFPDESHRYRIWKQHFPKSAPVAADVDFDYLAKRFALSGGHIRNVAVGAAFLAAANSGTIQMEHLIRATRREFEKMGKICTENEFAPFQWALRETGTEGHPGGKP